MMTFLLSIIPRLNSRWTFFQLIICTILLPINAQSTTASDDSDDLSTKALVSMILAIIFFVIIGLAMIFQRFRRIPEEEPEQPVGKVQISADLHAIMGYQTQTNVMSPSGTSTLQLKDDGSKASSISAALSSGQKSHSDTIADMLSLSDGMQMAGKEYQV